ncbi:MAG: undecaprenyl/decaprenyl-phosphate alpha-N-acetylglucosaminyl 1-phosphate transferase [Desulfobacteraceae bacterium]|nr:MAG: undecaprenyl/decaprenyl-phosphate alpha-N-acetylglucosaminyl 1-phosphate transferase [Desulfobacteraceae bacterium]
MKIKIAWQIFISLLILGLLTPTLKSFYFFMGWRWQYIFILSFLIAYFLIPFCKWAALKFKILDKPDWRKMHNQPTPLLGGVGIYLAFVISLFLNNVYLPGMKIILIGAGFIFFMGLWDDIKPIPALLKFIIQITIALVVILVGDIQMTFFYNTPWAPFINIPLTIFWIVGVTNALNFFDGIDGLAVSISIIIAFFLGVIAFRTNQPALGWFAVALIGVCLGFLPYNFRINKSAQLFLGDAGSTFLGFTLAGLALLGHWSTTNPFVSLAAPILIFGVLIFDMTYVNLSRIKNKQAKNFFDLLKCVNQDHLHHRLIFMGFAYKETVFIISTLSACLGVAALIIMKQDIFEALLGLGQAVLIFGLIMALMFKGRERIPKSGDRRNMQRRREDRLHLVYSKKEDNRKSQ